MLTALFKVNSATALSSTSAFLAPLLQHIVLQVYYPLPNNKALCILLRGRDTSLPPH